MTPAWSFIKRDIYIALSYRLKFITQFGAIIISTLMFFFMSKMVNQGNSPYLEPYGGDYFAFALIGIAFVDYLFISINSFSDEIRRGQLEGTLEALLLSPLSPISILFYSSLYSFFATSLRVLLYLLIGNFLLETPLILHNFLIFILILGLTVASFWGIGLLSATFVLLFKQKSPLNWLIGSTSGLLGGVLFPVEVLPDSLHFISRLLPITYSLEAMRKILLQGADLASIDNQLIILLFFAVALMTLGLFTFDYGLKQAKREGSLLQY